MSYKILTPRQALRNLHNRIKIPEDHFAKFEEARRRLCRRLDRGESEEFNKNDIITFLKEAGFGEYYYINTKDRIDAAIYGDSKGKKPIEVIIEVKRPGNRTEMVTRINLLKKSFAQLLSYYWEEVYLHKNYAIKHLVVTDGTEWYVFDAAAIDRIVSVRDIRKIFEEFHEKRLFKTSRNELYELILTILGDRKLLDGIVFSYAKLCDSLTTAQSVALCKFFSPEHLLKLPLQNDANTLNRRFYDELLYILGLEEAKVEGKKILRRQSEKRQGTFLEMAILKLETERRLENLAHPHIYGETKDERLFNVALELVITWLNRILFLKLLEAKLQSIHEGRYIKFLSLGVIEDFDQLNTLFFEVLARPLERRESLQIDAFRSIPYLNSTLFETTDLERATGLTISGLKDNTTLPLHARSVLQKNTKDENPRTLHYLLRFLDAYDFGDESGGEIAVEEKPLISASVLGLIYEKINGYKEGAYFTPAFVTTAMTRRIVRESVLERFSETFDTEFEDFAELKRFCGKRNHKTEFVDRANELVDTLTLCDPAVGSAHFLVSSLNEILYLKSELGILVDEKGNDPGVELIVENDEILVRDRRSGEPLRYNVSTRHAGEPIERMLFGQKRRIIENQLFGVDINPNSVKIARLRLWIELLKSAYYTDDEMQHLQTLPNIDINIKTGNSLLSRYGLNEKFTQRNIRELVERFKQAVHDYKEGVGEKRELERIIENLEHSFAMTLRAQGKAVRKLEASLKNYVTEFGIEGLIDELQLMAIKKGFVRQDRLFSDETITKAKEKERKNLLEEIRRQYDTIKEMESSAFYEEAFEWRFEFPEILNEEGDFEGFDIVIGNPPYIRQELFKPFKPYLKKHYGVFHSVADLSVYFIELGHRLLRPGGRFTYIVTNKWMRAGYGEPLRRFLAQTRIEEIVDFGDLQIFEDATTYPCILSFQKVAPATTCRVLTLESLEADDDLYAYIENHAAQMQCERLDPSGWTLTDEKTAQLLEKLKKRGTPLEEYVRGEIYRGILTGYNKAFVIDPATREALIAEDPSSAEIIKPFLTGKDVKRYKQPVAKNYLIFTRRGIDIDKYPAIKAYLEQFRERLEPKPKDWPANKPWPGRKQGSYKWYEIQDNIAYYEEFEKNKLIYSKFQIKPVFTLDYGKNYCNDAYFIYPHPDKFLLAILNSKIGWFFITHICTAIRGGYQLIFDNFKKFIVPNVEDKEKEQIVQLVDQIFEAKRDGLSTDDLEARIDAAVYRLFDLNEEEIAIVESAFPSSVTEASD